MKLTIDGKDIEVPAGTNLIEAARRAGIEVPHYCYHPGLSIAGQCRLCMVDIDKAPRPTIACNTPAADGMVVHTQSERVLDVRRSIMEFHLINHPLDCPVCDQSGECWLQIYYMKHGLYDPRMVDEKVHKPKAVPLGPNVILDAERCILCSRCVRFCDEVTRTGELGIFHRGDHSELGLFPGSALDNKYAGNVVDICPVGALTDRDFRFQVRVWYLDTAKSVCPGCARGCNVEIHVNRRRPHHAEGHRVARLKPRFNPDVNRWWMCDEGRYGFKFVDDPSRLVFPWRREGERVVELTWDEAIAGVAEAAGRAAPGGIGLIASPKMANEDLFALRRLAGRLGMTQVGFRVPPPSPGYEDDFLIRADKNPNTRGAELIGCAPAGER
ncbi:MAG: 2Fe-2S iron-sulfur cluster-binding protein, partial [Candidatus Rokuibacteriota bacterium]